MQLSKPLIVETSLGILNAYGLADMTMRRVSSQLGVAPGALYWHFKNKQALIDATARAILADWFATRHETFEQACVQLRAAMLHHRDGAELVSAAVSNAALREEVEAHVAATLDEPGARIGAVTALHFVLGSTVIAQSEQLARHLASDGSQEPSGCDAHADQFLHGVYLIAAGLRALESEA